MGSFSSGGESSVHVGKKVSLTRWEAIILDTAESAKVVLLGSPLCHLPLGVYAYGSAHFMLVS